jgi:non-canonical purine NTP pyrophosphatase (RdgB/HAM1 family)
MGDMRKVVLASRNEDKVRELKQVFEGMPFEVVSAGAFPGLPEVIEDGTTILGNATRKAMITAAYTGEIALADDTSLQVPELNFFPDIFAARFSGPEATYESNAALLVDLLQDVPDGRRRQARFETACVWIDPRPDRDEYTVARPALQRWLRNPWERSIEIKDPAEEWGFWNGILDRRQVWDRYVTDMLVDSVTWGHDKARLREIAEGLLAGCEEGGYEEGSLRIPDPRIWVVDGPGTEAKAPTVVAPSGLDREAPGRAVNGPFWFEISTEGRLLGDITRQPIGSMGFGYDPVFQPEEESRTLAEMLPAEKNAISHRARALRRLMRAVRGAYGV